MPLRFKFSSRSPLPQSHNLSYQAYNMGNCHSSQDMQGAPYSPPQVRPTPGKSAFSAPLSTQHPHQYPVGSHLDVGAPPPYSSQEASISAASVNSDSPYSFLREFDTIFLVDDSTSMLGRRWREAEDAIAAIAPVCTHYDNDGIDIYFLNHRSSSRDSSGAYSNIRTADDVREIFHCVSPRGATPVGRRLFHILGPYMKRLAKMTAHNQEHLVKPLNIIVITDGVFTDDAESIITKVAKQLDDADAVPWQVGIQFFQVGDDEQAKQYLQSLDDELGKMTRNEKLRDIVDTVPWKGDRGRTLNADGILKCVLGAVNRKYDKRIASRGSTDR